MFTEGWDCSTVTHIIGLRPFMSQLLCDQVVGRGLRRASYELGDDEKFTEEVAQVFGVPFEVIPFKANAVGPATPPPKRHHIHAIPGKAGFEIRYPRVEGYTQAIRNRVTTASMLRQYAEVRFQHRAPLQKVRSITGTACNTEVVESAEIDFIIHPFHIWRNARHQFRHRQPWKIVPHLEQSYLDNPKPQLRVFLIVSGEL